MRPQQGIGIGVAIMVMIVACTAVGALVGSQVGSTEAGAFVGAILGVPVSLVAAYWLFMRPMIAEWNRRDYSDLPSGFDDDD